MAKDLDSRNLVYMWPLMKNLIRLMRIDSIVWGFEFEP